MPTYSWLKLSSHILLLYCRYPPFFAQSNQQKQQMIIAVCWFHSFLLNKYYDYSVLALDHEKKYWWSIHRENIISMRGLGKTFLHQQSIWFLICCKLILTEDQVLNKYDHLHSYLNLWKTSICSSFFYFFQFQFNKIYTLKQLLAHPWVIGD